MPVPLETGPGPALETVAFAFQVVKALIGLTIAYIAYRGYRRNESRPMLAIAIGFVLVLGFPFVLFLLFHSVVDVPEVLVVLLAETSQVVGLFVILYALRMPT